MALNLSLEQHRDFSTNPYKTLWTYKHTSFSLEFQRLAHEWKWLLKKPIQEVQTGDVNNPIQISSTDALAFGNKRLCLLQSHSLPMQHKHQGEPQAILSGLRAVAFWKGGIKQRQTNKPLKGIGRQGAAASVRCEASQASLWHRGTEADSQPMMHSGSR